MKLNLIFDLFIIYLKRIYFGPFDTFLENTTGLIHIGANEGQERFHYKKYNISKVLWIEADPDTFKRLQKNISGLKNQKAINYLLLNKNKKTIFNVSSNEGNSSSILKFAEHKNVYPEIRYIKKKLLQGYTFSSLVKKLNIKLKHYNTLILDVQGSELLILKGAKKLLNGFKYIKLEASDFEVYKRNPTLKELNSYLEELNFFEEKRIKIYSDYKNKNMYDVLFVKK
jgi:FkbM family methyltransferase